jgi:RNA polymerase sigma-70 factor (ECF subfamily)
MEGGTMTSIDNGNTAAGMIPDTEIIQRVLGGDTAGFELIMRRYNRRLYRVARTVLRNDADAEDAVQDAYIRAYEHLRTFEGRGAFSAWLAKIALNEALARLRGADNARNHVSFDDPEESEGVNYMANLTSSLPSPEQNVARGEVRRLLESAIDALPDAYRMVFVLCGVEEMTIAETADCLDVEPATVKTRYHRARNILRQQLSSLVDSTAGEVFSFDGERCDRIVAGVLRRLEQKNGAGTRPASGR